MKYIYIYILSRQIVTFAITSFTPLHSWIILLQICSRNDIISRAHHAVTSLYSFFFFFFLVVYISLAYDIEVKTVLSKRLASQVSSSRVLSNALHTGVIFREISAFLFQHISIIHSK